MNCRKDDELAGILSRESACLIPLSKNCARASGPRFENSSLAYPWNRRITGCGRVHTERGWMSLFPGLGLLWRSARAKNFVQRDECLLEEGLRGMNFSGVTVYPPRAGFRCTNPRGSVARGSFHQMATY